MILCFVICFDCLEIKWLKSIHFLRGTWHAPAVLRAFFNLGCAEGLFFRIFINRLHGVLRGGFSITKLDVMSFEVHHIESDSSLQIAESLSNGNTCYHLCVTQFEGIFKLLVGVIFIKASVSSVSFLVCTSLLP